MFIYSILAAKSGVIHKHADGKMIKSFFPLKDWECDSNIDDEDITFHELEADDIVNNMYCQEEDNDLLDNLFGWQYFDI